MARPTQPLVWHQLRFALPLAQDAAVGLVERILADGSLGRVVLELRACAGQATWAVGSRAGERLARVVRELVPGCRVSAGFSRRAVSQPGTSDVSAAARDDAAALWAGAHSGQSARGVASVGRCAANDPASALPGSGSAGRCAHQRHEGAHHSTHESATAGCSSLYSSDEATAVSSAPGGAP